MISIEKSELIKNISLLDKDKDADTIQEIVRRLTPVVKVWQAYDMYENTERVNIGDELTLRELLRYGYNSIRNLDYDYMGCDAVELTSNNYNLDDVVRIHDFFDDADGYPCVRVELIKLVNVKFTININSSNDAFQHDNAIEEVVRILDTVKIDLVNNKRYGKCIDINGNGVGSWNIGIE